MIKLDFALRVSGHKFKKTDFDVLFKRGLAILKQKERLKMKDGEIHLVLVDDEEIELLNGLHRGKNEPTDVISLSYLDEDAFPERNLIGEIMISVETAQRQARQHKKTLKEEVQFLFVHGLLHIFGYTHGKAGERKEMFELQDEILRNK